MKELIEQLKTDPKTALSKLTQCSRDYKEIEYLRKEFNELDRDQRETQIGKVQKDKYIKGENGTKTVKAVRVPIPIQNKIVRTATAFEVGEPVTLSPVFIEENVTENNISKEILRLWRTNRIDYTLQKAIKLQKSELQCAILFYIKDMTPGNWLNKLIGINEKKEIKIDLLENENGKMTPVFDSFGDMTAFVWEFTTKAGDKEVKNAWVFDETKVYELSTKSGSMVLDNTKNHGFGKIPVVYFSQEKPEWHIAQAMIDRLEVSMSKLGASNDYAGHPILKLYGEVLGAPDKNEDGKAFRLKQKETRDGKVISSDVDFLTYDNASESVQSELDRLEKYIYSLTSTPDISLENIKGLGSSLSGIAIKLMFMDAIIKAKMNEGENRTAIERIINIFISGITTTTGIRYKTEAKNTFFDVQFNSILPDDLKESVETFARAKEAGIMSLEAIVNHLDMTGNSEQEINDIRENQPEPSITQE